MNYTKTIVCLANSRKTMGRCIAGKEVLPSGYGAWVRPVSHRPTTEILEYERRFENGAYPQVLDIITIPMIRPSPHSCQQENHLICHGSPWQKEGSVEWNELRGMADLPTGELWLNGYSSYNGVNDRMPEKEAAKLSNSLFLIQPERIDICISKEGEEFGNPRRKVRVDFFLNGFHYRLAATDPRIEFIFMQRPDGTYPLDASQIYMCVSISEPYKGFCYKIVASVIYPGYRHE